MSKLRKARLSAQLSLREVGAAINRSGQWVGLVERGHIQLSTDVEARVFAAIRRLSKLRATVRDSKVELVEDLRLPSAAGSSVR